MRAALQRSCDETGVFSGNTATGQRSIERPFSRQSLERERRHVRRSSDSLDELLDRPSRGRRKGQHCCVQELIVESRTARERPLAGEVQKCQRCRLWKIAGAGHCDSSLVVLPTQSPVASTERQQTAICLQYDISLRPASVRLREASKPLQLRHQRLCGRQLPAGRSVLPQGLGAHRAVLVPHQARPTDHRRARPLPGVPGIRRR